MTVNLTGGIDYTQWKPVETTGTSAHQKVHQRTQSNMKMTVLYQVQEKKCTDGKDDGKIGFFSAIGNAIKGVGKTIVNGVKGMFTDSEGNFSLGKTLLSVGTAALCIAVPAVGVAACAVGGVMGAVQVGKGIYSAATADTDAEAKEAWQNIGGGAFTVAASVTGAKAGVKGMQSAAAKTTKGSALEALKKSGTKLTTKTAGQYGKAFIQDGVRSGKYNLGQIRTSATAYAEAAKVKYSGGLTADELHTINTAKNTAINAAKHPLKTGKAVVEASISKIKSVKLSDVSAKLNELGGNAKEIFNTLKNGGYNEAIKNFSESEVAQVLEIVAGVTYANESI